MSFVKHQPLFHVIMLLYFFYCVKDENVGSVHFSSIFGNQWVAVARFLAIPKVLYVHHLVLHIPLVNRSEVSAVNSVFPCLKCVGLTSNIVVESQ